MGRKSTRLVTRFIKSWECDFCEKEFSNRTAYTLHVRVIHPDSVPDGLVCIGSGLTICGTCNTRMVRHGTCEKGCRKW